MKAERILHLLNSGEGTPLRTLVLKVEGNAEEVVEILVKT